MTHAAAMPGLVSLRPLAALLSLQTCDITCWGLGFSSECSPYPQAPNLG